MVRFTVETEAVINARANEVYAVLADYHDGHPNIVPKSFCEGVKVIKGTGIGGNSRIECYFNILGQRETLFMDVSEPEPGRILQEIDSKAINITRFIVDPIDDATCSVTIQTKVMKQIGFPPGPTIDMWLKKIMLKSMFKAELKLLNEFMATKTK
jgi:hypothetical protein